MKLVGKSADGGKAWIAGEGDENMEKELRERISQLERAHRGLKAAGLMGGVVVLGAFLMGPAPSDKIHDEVRSKVFAVVDEDGKTRAVLAAGGKGAGLIISDPNGIPKINLSASPNGTALHLANQDGKAGVMITVAPSGGTVVISDKEGRTIWKAP